MTAIKSDIRITIRAGERSFSIGGVLLPDGSYRIKRGRSWSDKREKATITNIFTEARKWTVRNA
jgi:hypothetical protein